ncbi:MAG: T9SS type A sorting domain-containing protein [Ignavibacteriaceae bacterium]|nr:T9SS type A sorting domain-containing protein [Ignavibacteriaceae bacterium]
MKTVTFFLFFFTLLAGVSSAQFVNGQAAEGVLGQLDYITPTSGVAINKFNGPNGVLFDSRNGKIWVADRGNHRVLRFSSTNAYINGGDAELVIGQPDFTTNTSGLSATKMNNPICVVIDGNGTLWVSEYGNNRVTRWDDPDNLVNGDTADGVLGQPDFVTNSAATSQNKFSGPAGIFVEANGTLWVSNFNIHRLLRFQNAATLPNGSNADLVIGQPDFVTGTAGLSATKMNNTNGVYVDWLGNLWVSEYTNRRVLKFNNASTLVNGDTADVVLGQPDFITNTSNTTQNGMGNVRWLTGDVNGNLYVVQESNNRISVFLQAATLANGSNADYVIGQPDFTTGTGLNPPTQNSLRTPRGASVDNTGKKLWVTDWANNRVLRYDISSLVPVELSSFSASVTLNNVELNWTTATETNNFGFSVERRSEDSEFEEIGFVKGNGTSTLINSYSFIDSKPLSGVVYYRLKQIDLDGSINYSNEVLADNTGLIEGFRLLGNYPNPFNPSTTISFTLTEKENVRVLVRDILGSEVVEIFNGIASPGINRLQWKGTNSMGQTVNSGVYFYTVEVNNKVYSGKMIFNK